MTSSVTKPRCAFNGNNSDGSAIGLDVMDAAYHTAQSFPGGVPALAQRMGMSQNTLAHKISLNNDTHHLTLREAVAMQELSGDKRITRAMCGALGGVFQEQQAAPKQTVMETVMGMAKDFGEVLVSVNNAIADGKVTLNEMHDCERQAANLMATINATLATVRGMMPKAPQA